MRELFICKRSLELTLELSMLKLEIFAFINLTEQRGDLSNQCFHRITGIKGVLSQQDLA